MENNISGDYLESVFSKFGTVIDIVMPKRKSHAFIVFDSESSADKAISELQFQEITSNQTPILYYLFPVDRG